MLRIGDPAPWFSGKTNQDYFSLSEMAGSYVILSFYGTLSIEYNRLFIENIIRNTQLLQDKRFCFLAISIDPKDTEKTITQTLIPRLQFLWDFGHELSLTYGAIDPASQNNVQLVYRPFNIILDPMLRVIEIIPIDSANHAARLEAALNQLPSLDCYPGFPIHAPVLLLPRVFEADFCQQLIQIHKEYGHYHSGFMQDDDAGYSTEIINDEIKNRCDFAITRDNAAQYENLQYEIKERLHQRLLPEIYKAFQFNVTEMERFVIGCYEAESNGHFKAHRDNFNQATQHRRFACTIYLNDDYEGGELRFPEFGPRNYSGPTGTAVVFSCSLLHEVLPVTRGKRFVFLPFFY